MAKVSVIVPVYNVEQYLAKCLDSLVNQTLEDIEIVVINDGTKDHSQDIIDQYAAKYPDKIKSYIKENGGISSVRNYGLKVAQGEYIGFVDSDDYVELNMYELLYENAKKHDANVSVADFWFTYEDHETVYHDYPYQSDKEMLTRLYAVLWNKIYKKSYLDQMDFDFPEGYRFEDASYLYHLAMHYDNYVFIDTPVLHYVQRATSITNTHNSKVKDAVYMLCDLLKYYQKHGKDQYYHEELEYLFIKFCLGQPFRSASKIKNSDEKKDALQLLWNTLNQYYPEWKKNRYLKELPGLKHRYFRIVNKPIYYISSFIFGLR